MESDITDYASISSVIRKYRPQYYANLAAQSHVHTSFHQPFYTWKTTAEAVMIALEAIKDIDPTIRFVQSTSSETFGKSITEMNLPDDPENPQPFFSAKTVYVQNEQTAMNPCSPYGVAKLAGYHITKVYRESYKLFASNAILFNTESERRGFNFVTRKITRYIAELLVLGHKQNLKLGNLDASRDWSHALDTCRGFKLLLDHNQPEDIIFSSFQTHTIRDFLNEAFGYVNLDWSKYVEIDPALYRPCEVPHLYGDNRKAQLVLNWKPQISFQNLVRRMVKNDISEVERMV